MELAEATYFCLG